MTRGQLIRAFLDSVRKLRNDVRNPSADAPALFAMFAEQANAFNSDYGAMRVHATICGEFNKEMASIDSDVHTLTDMAWQLIRCARDRARAMQNVADRTEVILSLDKAISGLSLAGEKLKDSKV